ncbi:MAG: alpha/beta fold hydrolase [Tumebacillaceae bacterium]
MPIFARHYTVLSYDVRGHGGTGPSRGPISIRDLSEDLHALFRHVGLERAVLVGYSSGTLVAEQFALDHPDKVAGLCLIGSYARVRGVYMRMKNNVSRWMVQSQLNKLLAYSVATTNAENIVQRGFFYRLAKRVHPEESLRIMEASERYLTAHEVSELKCPVLLVHGSRDRATETYAQEFARKLPCAEIAVVEGCNHAVATRAISEFNVLLENWLTSLHLPAEESIRHD